MDQNGSAEEIGGCSPRLGVSRRRISAGLVGPAHRERTDRVLLPGSLLVFLIVLVPLVVAVVALVDRAGAPAGSALLAGIVAVGRVAGGVDLLVVLEGAALVGVVSVLLAEEAPFALGPSRRGRLLSLRWGAVGEASTRLAPTSASTASAAASETTPNS